MDEHRAGERLSAARERAGLTEEQVAERVGFPVAWYRDLEHDRGELFSNISLAHLQSLAAALGLQPIELLLGHGLPPNTDRVAFSDLSALLRAHKHSAGLTTEELSKQVGWELKDVLIDPSELWNFTVDGLRDICARLDVEWTAALPDAGKDPSAHAV